MRKKVLLYAVIAISTFIGFGAIFHQTLFNQQVQACSLSAALLDNQGRPTADLLELLQATGINHDGTLAGIVQQTQKKQPEGWLRDPQKERWEIAEMHKEKHAILKPLFAQLNMLNQIMPCRQYYDYVVILGGTVHGVRARLAYLAKLWQNNVRFGSIIMLGSQRPLYSDRETKADLLNKGNKILPFKKDWQLQGELPATEIAMMRMVFEQSDLPASWALLPITFIDPPMKVTKEGKLTRPTTQDTIHAWLATQPKPGSVLAISSQPFVGYQDAVLRRFLPSVFATETVGPKAGKITSTMAILLDTLARWLYTELHVRKEQREAA